MDYFLVDDNGQSIGPYSLDQLKSFWAEGKITRETPVWTQGMASWQPIRTIEHSLLPSPRAYKPVATSPRFSSRRDQPGAKSSGCTRFLSGCLIVILTPLIAVVLITILGEYEQKHFLKHLSPEERSKVRQLTETQAKADAASQASFDQGFDSGYKWGYVCGLADYNHGALKEPSDQLEANARGLSEGDTDPQHRDGFIRGIESGYDERLESRRKIIPEERKRFWSALRSQLHPDGRSKNSDLRQPAIHKTVAAFGEEIISGYFIWNHPAANKLCDRNRLLPLPNTFFMPKSIAGSFRIIAVAG